MTEKDTSYIERMESEYSDLGDRVVKLQVFLDKVQQENKLDLNADQLALLEIQYAAMLAYHGALCMRIDLEHELNEK